MATPPTVPGRRRPSSWLLLTGLLLGLLTLGACGSDDGGRGEPAAAGDAAAPALAGTRWQLDTAALKVTDGAAVTATLAFADDGARVTGSDGCNSLTGSFTRDGASLTFGPLAGTRKACGPPADTVATQVLQGLTATRSYAVRDGGLLLLRDDAGKTLLPYRAYTPAAATGRWEAVNVLYADAIRGVVTGTTLTADFGKDGRVTGTAGCNRFGGDYTTDGTTLEIGPLVTTRRACLDDTGEVQKQEDGYLRALESARTFEQAGDRLTILDDEDRMTVVFQRAG